MVEVMVDAILTDALAVVGIAVVLILTISARVGLAGVKLLT